jgi:hypothetical protein
MLLYSLMLYSCQAFEQPPAGVLTPQELVLTSAAETIIADLAPLDTPAVPVNTNTAFPNNPDMITSTSEPSPTLTHTPVAELAPFLTPTPTTNPTTTPMPLETTLPGPTYITNSTGRNRPTLTRHHTYSITCSSCTCHLHAFRGHSPPQLDLRR